MELDTSSDSLTSPRIVLTLARELLGKGYTILPSSWTIGIHLLNFSSSFTISKLILLELYNSTGKLCQSSWKRRLTRVKQSPAFPPIWWHWSGWRNGRSTSYPPSTATTWKPRIMRKPTAVVTYNQNMEAVFLADQMLQSLCNFRKIILLIRKGM